MASRTVWIVDDDHALRNALAFEMSTQGYDVMEFADADAALQGSAPPTHACLVVDHRLPRLDGLFVIEALRARGAVNHAILVTSIPGPELVRRCSSLGVPIVEKPLIADELSLAVARSFTTP